MNQIPILFSTPMVQAILEGRKTQTRRIVKGTPLEWLSAFTPEFVSSEDNNLCPYGNPGDVLWVRETWKWEGSTKYTDLMREGLFLYKADNDSEIISGWKPSIHMPKAACRLFLKIQSVRIERLQDISEEDAKEEGIQKFTKDGTLFKYGLDGWEWSMMPKSAEDAFSILWAMINGQESWDSNPWVWVIEFEKTEKP